MVGIVEGGGPRCLGRYPGTYRVIHDTQQHLQLHSLSNTRLGPQGAREAVSAAENVGDGNNNVPEVDDGAG